MILNNPLLDRVLRDYKLDISGIHGLEHWVKVVEYGLFLSAQNGANPNVVTLFGMLHDSMRREDGRDPKHGPRASTYTRKLFANGLLKISKSELEILCEACSGHNGGQGHPDITVATCWDADRLDLHRFGWEIDPDQLNTEAGVSFVLSDEPEFIDSMFDPGCDFIWQLIEVGAAEILFEQFAKAG